MQRSKRTVPVILWLLSILWLLLALGLSSQTGPETGELSRKIAEFLGDILSVPETSMTAFHSGLRTAAHVIVYFVLAFLVCGATLATFPERRYAWLVGMLACIDISVIDEYRKAFIPGRHCSWSEAGLNVLGCVLGAVCVWAGWKLVRRRYRNKFPPDCG